MLVQNKASHGASLAAGTVGHSGSASCEAVPNRFYHNHNQPETIFVEDGKRRVAAGRYYARSKEFHKTVKANQILRKPESIAIQVSALRLLKERGCRKVVVWLADEERELQAPFEAFERFGVYLERGFGAQVALPLARWTDSRVRAAQLELW